MWFWKNYTKINFYSDDDLPLNKPLKFHNMTITITSVFEEDGKLYVQVSIDDTLYELNEQKIARMRKNWYFRRYWC